MFTGNVLTFNSVTLGELQNIEKKNTHVSLLCCGLSICNMQFQNFTTPNKDGLFIPFTN